MPIKDFITGFTNLVYPNVCPGCSSILSNYNEVICITCWSNLPKTYQYKDTNNHTAKLFWGRYPLEHAFATFQFSKKSKLQNIVHDFKYRGNKEIGRVLGVEVGKEVILSGLKIDVVIPVPLHPKKLKLRGYNQSFFIALGISQAINAPLDDTTLTRKVNTPSQTKKTKYERWKNVGEIFALKNPNQWKNKHILLVDDVITTGATIEGCCIALSAIEGIKISVVALASA